MTSSEDSTTITLLGIAVGMAIFVAVVAIVVACILWQRQRPYKSRRLHSVATPGQSAPQLEEVVVVGRSPVSLSPDRRSQTGASPDRNRGRSGGNGFEVGEGGDRQITGLHDLAAASFDIQRVVQFQLKELQEACDNFSMGNRLGEGSYGMVYKAKLKSGELVAVKRAKPDRKQDVSKFRKEVELLSRVSHKHLMRLVGFCKEGGEQLLVYEYIAGGNLSQNLSRQWRAKQNCTPLSWTERLMVAVGVGRALSYLHEEINTPFIHRDVKASNILIDKNVVAKLADFGTTKPMSSDELRKMSATIQGTAGYCDPDYLKSGVSSKRIDVYSFGIVLMELITGEGPHKIVKPFRFYVEDKLRRYGLDVVVDQSMGQYSKEEVQHILDLAFRCTDLTEPESRPSMGRVVSEIEAVLEPERRLRPTAPLSMHSTSMDRIVPPPVAGMRTAQAMLASASGQSKSPMEGGGQKKDEESEEWSPETVSGQLAQAGSFDQTGVYSFGDVEPA